MRRHFVIGTIGLIVCLVVGLCFAAINRVRGLGDEYRCRSNLRLVGLSLHNYHDVGDAFPPGTYPNPELPPERRLSWLFEIDPYVHARMDPTWLRHSHEAWDSEGNLALQRGRMSWFECPPIPETKPRDRQLGNTNYVGVAGIGHEAPTLAKTSPVVGVFGYDRKISLKDITDGAENTVMVIESLFENGPWVAGGPATVRGLVPDAQSPMGRGRQFGGSHRRGVMALFADASVHFIRDSVSTEVLSALFTISRGDSPESVWDD